MSQEVKKAKNVYNNFIIKLNRLRTKQFNLLDSFIKTRDAKKIEELKQEFKKYE